VATVPLPGLVQFNDEPEGDGVSAAQKTPRKQTLAQTARPLALKLATLC